MNRDNFENLLANLWGAEMDISRKKGKDYSGDMDVLSNFKRIADELDSTPEIVLYVYFAKHLDAVRSYIKNGELESESLENRIVDMRLYLALLYAMYCESVGDEYP